MNPYKSFALLVATLAIGGAVSACTPEEQAAADRFEAIWTGTPTAEQVAFETALVEAVESEPAVAVEEVETAVVAVAELPAPPVEPEPIVEVCVPVFRVRECP